MYIEYYNMTMEPFPVRPATDAFFASPMHKNALELLKASIQYDEPLILVHGEYGTGKTLICLKLMEFFQHSNKAYMFFPAMEITWIDVLRKVADYAGISYPENVNAPGLMSKIYDYYSVNPEAQSMYLVFDDFQDMYTPLIYHIKKIINFNVTGRFPIKIIIVAHSFVLENIKKDAELAPFLQRLRRQILLPPLSHSAMREYIYFRLFNAGAKGRPVFTDNALEVIRQKSRCIPRLINNICNAALVVAAQKQIDQIDADIVHEAEVLYCSSEISLQQECEADVEENSTVSLENTIEEQKGEPLSYAEIYIGHGEEEANSSETKNGHEKVDVEEPVTVEPSKNISEDNRLWYLVVLILAMLLVAALTFIVVDRLHRSDDVSYRLSTSSLPDSSRAVANPCPQRPISESSTAGDVLKPAGVKPPGGGSAPANYSYTYDVPVDEPVSGFKRQSAVSSGQANVSLHDKTDEQSITAVNTKSDVPMTAPLADDFILPVAGKENDNGK